MLGHVVIFSRNIFIILMIIPIPIMFFFKLLALHPSWDYWFMGLSPRLRRGVFFANFFSIFSISLYLDCVFGQVASVGDVRGFCWKCVRGFSWEVGDACGDFFWDVGGIFSKSPRGLLDDFLRGWFFAGIFQRSDDFFAEIFYVSLVILAGIFFPLFSKRIQNPRINLFLDIIV